MEGEGIDDSEQLRELEDLDAVGGGGLPTRRDRIGTHHPGSERPGPAPERPPDPTEADDPDGHRADRATHRLRPAPGPHPPVDRMEAPGEGDQVREGDVGDVVVEGPRDLVVGVGQAVVGVAKVINPVNVYGHLVGSNDDLSSRPGTIVGATRISERAGEFDGWAGVLSLLAAVNVSVGVFNMFPLLPLDGGHAAIATYERLRSRRGHRYRADISKLMPVAAVCIALLAFMFLTGLYLDTLQF